MKVFIAAVSVALIVSFLCSIFESVLLSINHAQVELLNQQGKRSGNNLKPFKSRNDLPIADNLTTNTTSHTLAPPQDGREEAPDVSGLRAHREMWRKYREAGRRQDRGHAVHRRGLCRAFDRAQSRELRCPAWPVREHR